MQELQEQLQVKDAEIIRLKNVRPFNHNLQKYLAISSKNKIKVLEGDNLVLLETL
jgi:hypothetical protein